MNSQGAQDVTAKWNFAHRVAFRFAFLYLGLYNVEVLTNTSQSIVPGLSHLMAAYGRLWHTIVPWVGQNILRLETPITYFLTGSGDGISEWVTVLCYLAIAVVGTVVWSILDRRRPNYRFSPRVAARLGSLLPCIHDGSLRNYQSYQAAVSGS